MGDERVRELERRWKETGALADEGAFLAECVRVGRVPRERVEVAARLGDPGSQLALSEPSNVELGEALRAIGTLDRRLLVRAMALLAEQGLDRWDRVMKDARPRGVLRALADWVERPDRGAARRVQDATEAAAECADRSGYFLAQNFPEGAFTMREMAEIEAIARAAQRAGEVAVASTMRPRDAAALDAVVPQFVECVLSEGLAPDEALALVREALVPHLLGREEIRSPSEE